MLTAVVSIIVSVAVVAVAIPKGISEYADEPDISTTTTIPPRVKGALGAAMTTLTSGDTPSSALALGAGLWLAASEKLSGGQDVSVGKSGAPMREATIVADVAGTGTALVRTTGDDSGTRPIDLRSIVDPGLLGDLSRYWLYDPATEQMSRLEPSITSTAGTDDVPVSTREPIAGIASVVDDTGTVVGIVVRRGHSTWLLGRSSIRQLMKSMRAR